MGMPLPLPVVTFWPRLYTQGGESPVAAPTARQATVTWLYVGGQSNKILQVLVGRKHIASIITNYFDFTLKIIPPLPPILTH